MIGLISVLICAKVYFVVLVYDDWGIPLQNAHASIVLRDGSYFEDYTDERGIAVVESCQGQDSYLAVEFGNFRQTDTIVSKGTGRELYYTIPLKRTFMPILANETPEIPWKQE